MFAIWSEGIDTAVFAEADAEPQKLVRKFRELKSRPRLYQTSSLPMVGERVQFDDKTGAAIEAVASESGCSFQEIADEAFADFLKKHKHPVGFKAAVVDEVEPAATSAVGCRNAKTQIDGRDGEHRLADFACPRHDTAN